MIFQSLINVYSSCISFIVTWCLEMSIQRFLLCHTPWMFFFPWMLRRVVVVLLLSCVWPFCNPLDCRPQDFFSWNFPGRNVRGLPFPSPGDIPAHGLNPSPAAESGFFTTELPRKPYCYDWSCKHLIPIELILFLNKKVYSTRKQKKGSEMFKLSVYVFADSLPKFFKHYSISSHIPFTQLPQMLILLYYYSMIVKTRNFTLSQCY